MLIRLVKEMIDFEEYYITRYKNFAVYATYFAPGMNLTKIRDIKIYQNEIEAAGRDKVELGMFHIVAYAEVLGRRIYSVFPQYGGYTVRKDCHTKLDPRIISTVASPVYVMWTSISGMRVPAKEWKANHFVTLLPLHEDIKDVLLDDMDVDFDLTDTHQ